MPSLYIAVPNLGSINQFVAQKLVELALWLDREEEGYLLKMDYHSDKPIDNCRNKIVKNFLDSECEWFFTIDSDNPPIGNPLVQIPLGKDILAFPTPIWYTELIINARGENPIVWNCFDIVDDGGWREHYPQSGLQEIDAAGTGCMLIHRRVLEKVKPAFIRKRDEWGRVTVGSDLLFCQRAKEAGFKVWADYTNPCRHYKSIDLAQAYNVMKQRDIAHANLPNINTAEYWDNEWKKRRDTNRKIYSCIEDRIVKSMNCARPVKILDFGCGRGELMERVGKIEGCELHGIDISEEAVRITRERGFSAEVGTEPTGKYDIVIMTEVLEHLDNDLEVLSKAFGCADRVMYTVPHNCLPPGLEREHRRVYTEGHIKRITPYLTELSIIDGYILAVADRLAFERSQNGST
jgi:hypothetical protein